MVNLVATMSHLQLAKRYILLRQFNGLCQITDNWLHIWTEKNKMNYNLKEKIRLKIFSPPPGFELVSQDPDF